MVTIDLPEIAMQRRNVAYENREYPGMLWVGQGADMEIRALAATTRFDNWTTFTADPVLFGMHVQPDSYLPPDVWRLADEHGTLLYDCRQGKVVP